MSKYLCEIKATITLTREVYETIEVESPDEVQAEDDALTAASLLDSKTWLENPGEFSEEHDFDFKINEIIKKEE